MGDEQLAIDEPDVRLDGRDPELEGAEQRSIALTVVVRVRSMQRTDN